MQSSNVVPQTSPQSLAVIPSERRRNNPTRISAREQMAIEKLRARAEDTSDGAARIEGAVRAIAYLLDYASEMGNTSVSGVASSGLGALLESVADDVKRHDRFVRKLRGAR